MFFPIKNNLKNASLVIGTSGILIGIIGSLYSLSLIEKKHKNPTTSANLINITSIAILVVCIAGSIASGFLILGVVKHQISFIKFSMITLLMAFFGLLATIMPICVYIFVSIRKGAVQFTLEDILPIFTVITIIGESFEENF